MGSSVQKKILQREYLFNYSGRLLRGFEDDADLGFDLDRVAIKQVRAILPAEDGIGSGPGQHAVTAEDLHVANIAPFSDGGQQLHYSFFMELQGHRGIDGRDLLKQKSLGNALRDPHRVGGRLGKREISRYQLREGSVGVAGCGDHQLRWRDGRRFGVSTGRSRLDD